MIVFTVDDSGLIKDISRQLGEYSAKAPTVLMQAINAAAKETRRMLADKAGEAYVVQRSRFNKAMKIKNASISQPAALIKAKGKPLELLDFKVNPKKFAVGDARPEIRKAKVLAKSGLKRLEAGGIKAFVARFQSGHLSLVQRRGQGRFPLKTLFSSSIPKMIGDERRVYGLVAPEIGDILNANIRKAIQKTIERGQRGSSR